MIGKQGISLLIGHNGIQDKTSLDPANETVARGIYDPTTLSAVDADLQAANIKLAENIFGFVGTLAGGGVETIDYANAIIANNATYTPGNPGIFFKVGNVGGEGREYSIEYFSTADAAWHTPGNWLRYMGATAIGDGTNFRIKNNSGGNAEYGLMRHNISTWTYERARDEDLAAGATWTPATSGFFAMGTETTGDCEIEIQLAGAGWEDAKEVGGADYTRLTIVIGDGTNFRVKNNDGVAACYHVTMRAALT